MIHGTLLFDTDLNALRSALRGAQGRITSNARPSRPSPVANVAGLLRRPMGMADFTRQVLAAFAADHGGWRHRRLQPGQWDAVRRLAREKYRCWDWNFGRSPTFHYHRTAHLRWGAMETVMEVRRGCVHRAELRWPAAGGSLALTLAHRLPGVRFTFPDIYRLLGDLDLATAEVPGHREELAAHLCGC